MNLLAHAYLSFNVPGILVGNMISDFVKGRAKFEYPEAIQKGISLHRDIDEFTDFHPATQEAKKYFRAQYRLYSGPFIDIVYDHFLANDQNEFPSERHLLEFTLETYRLLSDQQQFLPDPFSRMLPYMKEQNWLYNYRKQEGISSSFKGMVRRARYLDESDIAYTLFQENYEALRVCYAEFFPSLKDFVLQKFQSLDLYI